MKFEPVDVSAELEVASQTPEQALGAYSLPLPTESELDAKIFSQEYLNLKESFPDEAVEYAVSDMVKLAMQVTESSVKLANNDSIGDIFLYTMTIGPRGRKQYTPVLGLNQTQRAAAVMLLLRKRWRTQAMELDHVSSAVAALANRAAELEAEASKLTRWDLFLMAIFGKEIVTERIRRRRVAENKPAIEL